jgi:pimeloyl-ACP methyl ester carboxylesterase
MHELLSAYRGDEGGRRLIRAARDLDPEQTRHIAERLRASGVPALVLWGERDRFLPLDCPAEVAAALRDFLRRLP